MNYATFESEGYYFNNGQELVQPGMALKRDEGSTKIYYKLIRDENNGDRVYLEQYESDEPIDLDPATARDLLHPLLPVPEEEQQEMGLRFSR